MTADDFFGLLLLIVITTGIMGIGAGIDARVSNTPNNDQRKTAVCDYLGGKVQGAVCIKNDKIIEKHFGKDK